MVNGNGQGQLATRNVAIPHVDEPTTDVILVGELQKGNAPDPMQ